MINCFNNRVENYVWTKPSSVNTYDRITTNYLLPKEQFALEKTHYLFTIMTLIADSVSHIDNSKNALD